MTKALKLFLWFLPITFPLTLVCLPLLSVAYALTTVWRMWSSEERGE